MLLLTLVSYALSSSVPCDIPYCESCSIQSATLCINCLPGYTRESFKCIHQSDFLREPIENCLSYSKDLSCTTCKSGYFPLFGRCEPYCPSTCICIFPNTCHQYRNLDDTNSSDNDTDSSNASGKKNDDGRGKDDSDKDDSNGYDHGDHDDQYECEEGCNRCSSYNVCEDCEKSYNLTNGTCVAAWCHSKCEICSGGVCSKCSESYYLQDNTCKNCPRNCKKCSNDTYCEECESGNATGTGKCLSITNKSRVKTSKSIITPIVSSFGGIILILGIAFCVINKRKRDNAKKNRTTIDANEENTPGFKPIDQIKKEDDYEEPSGIMINNEVNNWQYENPPLSYLAAGPAINENNFDQIVRKVQLDKDNKYYEQDVCVICIQKFEPKAEIRVLPCNHAFHETCIFKAVAIGSERTCPICRHQYS